MDGIDSNQNKVMPQIAVDGIYGNLSQNIIQITESDLRLILRDGFENIESKKSWIGPFSLFSAVLTTLCTTDFKDKILPGPTWQAIFVILCAISAIWTFWEFWRAFNSITIEDIIENLKSKKH